MLDSKEFRHGIVAVGLALSYDPIINAVLKLPLIAPNNFYCILAIAGLGLFLIATYFFAISILNSFLLFRPFRFWRTRLRPPTEMEGYWYQHIDGIPERPHSISQIRFDHAHYRWVYEGAALDHDGNLAARWLSYSIYYDDDTNQWFLMGKAELMVKNDNVNNFRPDSKDGEVLTIIKMPSNGYDAVGAVCIDYGAVIGSKGRHYNVAMTRIGKADFKKARPGGFGAWREDMPPRLGDIDYDTLQKVMKIVTFSIDR